MVFSGMNEFVLKSACEAFIFTLSRGGFKTSQLLLQLNEIYSCHRQFSGRITTIIIRIRRAGWTLYFLYVRKLAFGQFWNHIHRNFLITTIKIKNNKNRNEILCYNGQRPIGRPINRGSSYHSYSACQSTSQLPSYSISSQHVSNCNCSSQRIKTITVPLLLPLWIDI